MVFDELSINLGQAMKKERKGKTKANQRQATEKPNA
jgi:hypothetical protein